MRSDHAQIATEIDESRLDIHFHRQSDEGVGDVFLDHAAQVELHSRAQAQRLAIPRDALPAHEVAITIEFSRVRERAHSLVPDVPIDARRDIEQSAVRFEADGRVVQKRGGFAVNGAGTTCIPVELGNHAVVAVTAEFRVEAAHFRERALDESLDLRAFAMNVKRTWTAHGLEPVRVERRGHTRMSHDNVTRL